MLTDPGTLLGLGDGGAHVGQIVDAGLPSYMLTHWARDRKRGPGLALEFVVKRRPARPPISSASTTADGCSPASAPTSM